MKRIAILFFGISILAIQNSHAQNDEKKPVFTHADTLRGSITPERAWWDVIHYSIRITPDYEKKFTRGENEIRFHVLKPGRVMQIDLQEPMKITEVIWKNEPLKYSRNGNVFLIVFPMALTAGKMETVRISFEGSPRIAARPPWDGGWIFTKDSLGRPWMTVACQGLRGQRMVSLQRPPKR